MGSAPLTKQQYVYQTIRENILSGSLEPGTRLTLADLAERFGVSPIPIREALRQLEQEALIEMTPHVKIVVRGVTVQEAIWVAELRILLEPPAAREAATHLTDADLTVLRLRFQEMQAEADEGDFEGFAKARYAFHDALFRRLPNRRWHRTLMGLWETAQRYRNVFREVERLDDGRGGLVRTMAALERRDLDELEVCYRERREWSLKTLVAWAAREQDTAELGPMPPAVTPAAAAAAGKVRG